MDETKSLGLAMKKWRKENQINWRDFGKKVDIPRSTFSRYENFEGAMPGGQTLLRLSALLGLSIDEIVKMAEYDAKTHEQ